MSNRKWQLNSNIAERYEEFLVPVVFVPWAQDLLGRAGLGPGDRLLDLACGTGIVARMAAGNGVSVTGSDNNPGMLAVAAECAKGLEITFRQADARDLPFEDESFDAVICQHGLQFFPDKPGAVSECFRVLKPGGRAVFCTARSLQENPLMQAQVVAYGKLPGGDATGPIRAVCGFAKSDDMLAVFEGAGFSNVEVHQVTLELAASDASAFVEGLMKATPVAERIAEIAQSEREIVRDAILEEFGNCYDGSGLRFPHSANVVVATRSS